MPWSRIACLFVGGVVKFPENRSFPGCQSAQSTSRQVMNATPCAGATVIGHGSPSDLQGLFRLGEH